MKLLKIMLITLILGGLSVPLLSCGSKSDEVGLSENQIVAVQRGNLVIDITAAGNLALSRTEDLAFDVFYQEGTVEEVLVEEGDAVEEGQVLAKLDTSEWEDNLEVLEDKLTTAERQLTAKKREVTAKERAVTAAEQQLETKKRAVTTKERDVLQAEINLKNAEIALEQAKDVYRWPELEVAMADVDEAEANLEYALLGLDEATGGDTVRWQRLINRYSAILDAAEVRLNAMLTGADPEEVEIKEVQVEIAQGKLEEAREAVKDAQIAVEDAQKDIEDAQIALEDAQIAVEDAQKDVEDAREALDEALSTSLKIVAPFDGFITKVSVEGGDEVKTGTVAVQLADPNKFEADILVSEMDILQVKVGGEAWVQVDAMQGVSLLAKVTHISPTATIQSGVVNYKVKVEIQSLQAVQQERQAARQKAMQGIQQGELPERLKQAIAAGQITQEQAEEMIKQMQQTQGGQQGVPTMIPEDFQLREGLTVTVNILVDEASDVLMVPNSAITRQGVQSYVKVVSPDGTIEERAIQTGISDWQYTEVTEGLDEGEQVAVPQGTTATTTTQQGSRRGPMPFLPPH